MARICPLFSGSTGNSTYISTASGGFLIDAGASFKRLCSAIENAGGDMGSLRAIAVTHEHTDHVKGLRQLLQHTGIPLIASRPTLEVLIAGDLIPAGTQLIAADETQFVSGDVKITRFPTSHDCAGSSGYVLTLPDGRRIAVCTDLGIVTDAVRGALHGCALVLLESNHDIRMLQHGPYPPATKLRILSDQGHLSNNACACELPSLLQSGTTRFILGHISRNNNLPMLALSAAKASLMDVGADYGRDYLLAAARPADNEATVL